MRRRDLFALPAAVMLPAPSQTAEQGPRKVVKVILNQEDPYSQLERLWHFGTPVRIVTRPHPDWWPSRVELPDRWQAWVETIDGATVLIECRPRRATAFPHSARTGRVSSLIAGSLRTA
ncbi:MAG: hypothetical protein J0H49_16205 [Acidobacteria bacterium]|nr:hypothetical protein [Acidobacteriota bacterium]